MRPSVIGPGQRYRPSELLSEDQLGTLWRGTDVRSGSVVTVRFLDERLTSDPYAMHQATTRLRWAQWGANPHLARVLAHNLGTPEDRPAFVVSEASGGQTLKRHLARGEAFSVRRALGVIAAVADGLASAHEAWVYHGALTSASILMDDNFVAKVTDIGLGELLDDGNERGRSVLPSSLNDRGAADVLAVAVLFEQLLSGGPGREAGIRVDTADGWAMIPDELGDLVRRALSPHPLHRPSMAELATALALGVTTSSAPDADVSEVVRLPPPPRLERMGRPDQAGPVGGDVAQPVRQASASAAIATAGERAAHVPASRGPNLLPPGEPRGSRRLLLVAALVVGLALVGGIAFALSGGDEDVRAVVPIATGAAATGPAETGPTGSTGVVEPSIPPVEPPRNVDVIFAGAELVRIEWQVPNAGSLPIRFMVFRDGEKVGSVTRPLYRDTDVASGEQHVYRIVSVGEDGSTARSNRVIANVPVAQEPAEQPSTDDGVAPPPPPPPPDQCDGLVVGDDCLG